MAASASRVYSVTSGSQTPGTTAPYTAIQIKAGATVPLRLLRAELGQSASTTSTMQRIQINRFSAACTVTSSTPVLNGPSTDPAASAVGGTAATGITSSSEGTVSAILRHGVFNWLNGWLFLPSPEERCFINAAGIAGLSFPSSPQSGTYWGDLVFEELA